MILIKTVFGINQSGFDCSRQLQTLPMAHFKVTVDGRWHFFPLRLILSLLRFARKFNLDEWNDFKGSKKLDVHLWFVERNPCSFKAKRFQDSYFLLFANFSMNE